MSNSPLVSYTRISPNRNSPRNHKIDTITIHCVVGQCSVESLGATFAPEERRGSSNYGIGKDGRIGMYVEEKDRAWTSSSGANDNRAITIECASDTKPPYAINDKVYKSLIELCADICKRNGIKELKWKADKSLIGKINQQNMTVHRWFAATACPGDYIYTHLGDIAKCVNEKLGVKTETETEKTNKLPKPPFSIKVLIEDLKYYSGPGDNYKAVGQTGKGLFTITEIKNGWGKLKSGAGWVYLENSKWCKIINTKAINQLKSIDEIAKEVIQGKWGSGTARKRKLEEVGYDYQTVQKRVNELL